MGGIQMMLDAFGITPDKLQEMVKPITDAIEKLDANNAERVFGLDAMITARFDALEQLVREQGGEIEAAGYGVATREAGYGAAVHADRFGKTAEELLSDATIPTGDTEDVHGLREFHEQRITKTE